jgi:L-alanine-DL-glutamate epimerase-like enolase superfamily enzyme
VAAPVSIAHTHVHSMRVEAGANAGAEALVARVLAADGAAGFGFTLNLDAGVARDMAAWDALGRSKQVPLFALLGGSYRKTVRLVKDELPAIPADWTALRKDILEGRHELLRIDPFAWGSVEMVQTIAAVAAAFDLSIALFAPNAHPWELQYCAALAATLKGEDTRIIIRSSPSLNSIPISQNPGIGIDWSLEPSFSKIQWQS